MKNENPTALRKSADVFRDIGKWPNGAAHLFNYVQDALESGALRHLHLHEMRAVIANTDPKQVGNLVAFQRLVESLKSYAHLINEDLARDWREEERVKDGETIDLKFCCLLLSEIIDEESEAMSANQGDSNRSPTKRKHRKHKADAGNKLKKESKKEIVLRYLQQNPHDITLPLGELAEKIDRDTGLKLSKSTLSRYLKELNCQPRRGNPHRAAKGKGEREPIADEGAADMPDIDAYTAGED